VCIDALFFLKSNDIYACVDPVVGCDITVALVSVSWVLSMYSGQELEMDTMMVDHIHTYGGHEHHCCCWLNPIRYLA
jgi:hypothetical protein